MTASELMKVALPAVGVMDMLRYHTFTAGAGWAYDYGTAQDSEEMFEYIKGYSPVHNVSRTHYPATMVTTEITMIECLRIVLNLRRSYRKNKQEMISVNSY
jgi:prolyl oligopeptidase PreP (S9A serine peptidase family)